MKDFYTNTQPHADFSPSAKVSKNVIIKNSIKCLLLVGIILFTFSVSAQKMVNGNQPTQITSYSLVSEKTYPDNKRTCYFESLESLTPELKLFLQSKIEGDENIFQLSFSKDNGNTIMFNSVVAWNMDNTVTFINELLTHSEEIARFMEDLSNGNYTVNKPVSSRADCSEPLIQPNGCGDAAPFCTSYEYCFPASTNVLPGLGYIGCLVTTPNPAWYWMEIEEPGSMQIYIEQRNAQGLGRDVDFICWGPYTSVAEACSSISYTPCTPSCPNNTTSPYFYPHGNIVDCSYDAAIYETVHLNNTQAGQVYLLLLTNYSNQTANITFSKIGGTATTNCGIITPPASNNGPLCIGETLQLTAQTSSHPDAVYHWTGPNGFTSDEQNPTIPNVTFDNAGTYTLVITAGGLSGDPKTTDVVINEPSFIFIEDTICEGDSYDFYGELLETSGVYTYTINEENCGSFVVLTLTVKPETVTNISAYICDGESYNFFGTMLTTAGFYYHTLTQSCTIVMLKLTVGNNVPH
jgi:hypothetical protein